MVPNQEFGLASRIRDIVLWDELNIELKCQSKCALAFVFLASNSLNNLEGQKKHVHIKTPGILNKYDKNKNSVGCVVQL
jgi:hypothetical protein